MICFSLTSEKSQTMWLMRAKHAGNTCSMAQPFLLRAKFGPPSWQLLCSPLQPSKSPSEQSSCGQDALRRRNSTTLMDRTTGYHSWLMWFFKMCTRLLIIVFITIIIVNVNIDLHAKILLTYSNHRNASWFCYDPTYEEFSSQQVYFSDITETHWHFHRFFFFWFKWISLHYNITELIKTVTVYQKGTTIEKC